MASKTGAGSLEEAKIPCTSVQQLNEELSKLSDILEPEEKEDTWQKFEKALLRFAAVTRGGGYKFTDVYVRAVGPGPLGDKLVACVMSDRGKLSGVATDLLNTMIPRLALNFAPLIIHYLPPIIRIFSRSNKVYTRRSEKCLFTIITHCPVPSMIGMIRLGVTDKAEGTRKATGAALEKIMSEWDRQTIGLKGIVELELGLRKMATERDPEVRKMGKRMWEVYTAKWPERVDDFTAPLTPTIRKYLDIHADRKAATRKEPTLAQSTVVRQAVARGPASGQSQKAPQDVRNHPEPKKTASELTAPLVARVRVTSLSKPMDPPLAGEMVSFTPLEKPDPFAPVHPKAYLGRSVSSAVAGPSTFASRPIQMRSASVMLNGGHDLAHLASHGAPETVGPSRPRIPHSATMSDLMGPPRFNDGPVRPQRPAHLLSGLDVRDPTTPLPKPAGPVRPARELLIVSQYGKAPLEVARKDPISAPLAKRTTVPTLDKPPATAIPLSAPLLDRSVAFPASSAEVMGPRPPMIQSLAIPTSQSEPPVIDTSSNGHSSSTQTEAIMDKPNVACGSEEIIADLVHSANAEIKPAAPLAESALSVIPKPAIVSLEIAKSEEPAVSHAEVATVLRQAAPPSLEDASIAQLEELLAKAKAKKQERGQAIDGTAIGGPILAKKHLEEGLGARREDAVDAKRRPPAAEPAASRVKANDNRPSAIAAQPDNRRREAFKPTASAGSRQPEPRKAEPAITIKRKPPVPAAPTKSTATIKRAVNQHPLTASTSSSLSSSVSRVKLLSAMGKEKDIPVIAPILAVGTAAVKAGNQSAGKINGSRPMAVPAGPSSPRKARVKLKPALPPAPARNRPVTKPSSGLSSVPETRPATNGEGKTSHPPRALLGKGDKARGQNIASSALTDGHRAPAGTPSKAPGGISSSSSSILALATVTPLPESPRASSSQAHVHAETKQVTALAIDTPLPMSPTDSREQGDVVKKETRNPLSISLISVAFEAERPGSATSATSAVSHGSSVASTLPPPSHRVEHNREHESDGGLDGVSFLKRAPLPKVDGTAAGQQVPFPSVLEVHTDRNRGPKAEHDLTVGTRSTSKTCSSLDNKTTSTVARIQALYEAREFIPAESPLRSPAVSLKTTIGGKTPRKAYSAFESAAPASSPAAFSLRSV